MITTATPYEFVNNTICVKGAWLVNDLGLSNGTYKSLTYRGWLNIIRRGGNGREALIEFDSMRSDIKEKVVATAGDPYKVAVKSMLQDLVVPDVEAAKFYSQYRKPNGEPLSENSQQKYLANACIYNAIAVALANEKLKTKAFGTYKLTKIWKRLSEAVNQLTGLVHSVPGKPRPLQRAFEKYKAGSYDALIHRNEGNQNGLQIKGACADWILGFYCLPNKPTVSELMRNYAQVRGAKGFPDVTEQAVGLWLDKPENKRVWMLARHGKEAWKNNFGHHLKRDKDNWFPNAYWAIDGTKFDAIHYFDNKTGMAALMKINVVVDIFSEKIIGWSFSKTETHIDHFTALKMAFKTSGCRPYLLTYDQQSGHKSKRMQELYNALVATKGGTHYKHRAYRHSNPIEQILGRIQQQEIGKWWFSDKQSPTVRKMDNKPNIDFIQENKHRLPSIEEVETAWEISVKNWNESTHPKYTDKTRNEVYALPMDMREDVDAIDAISIFWINQSKPITYKRGGLTLRVGQEAYDFEVYTSTGEVDIDFRRKHVGNKFVVRYDPEFLDASVQLFLPTATGLVHIADAEPKHAHETVPALMGEGDKVRINQDLKTTELEYQRDLNAYMEVMKRSGITAEELIENQELLIKMKGDLPKEVRNELEAQSSFSRL